MKKILCKQYSNYRTMQEDIALGLLPGISRVTIESMVTRPDLQAYIITMNKDNQNEWIIQGDSKSYYTKTKQISINYTIGGTIIVINYSGYKELFNYRRHVAKLIDPTPFTVSTNNHLTYTLEENNIDSYATKLIQFKRNEILGDIADYEDPHTLSFEITMVGERLGVRYRHYLAYKAPVRSRSGSKSQIEPFYKRSRPRDVPNFIQTQSYMPRRMETLTQGSNYTDEQLDRNQHAANRAEKYATLSATPISTKTWHFREIKTNPDSKFYWNWLSNTILHQGAADHVTMDKAYDLYIPSQDCLSYYGYMCTVEDLVLGYIVDGVEGELKPSNMGTYFRHCSDIQTVDFFAKSASKMPRYIHPIYGFDEDVGKRGIWPSLLLPSPTIQIGLDAYQKQDSNYYEPILQESKTDLVQTMGNFVFSSVTWVNGATLCYIYPTNRRGEGIGYDAQTKRSVQGIMSEYELRFNKVTSDNQCEYLLKPVGKHFNCNPETKVFTTELVGTTKLSIFAVYDRYHGNAMTTNSLIVNVSQGMDPIYFRAHGNYLEQVVSL